MKRKKSYKVHIVKSIEEEREEKYRKVQEQLHSDKDSAINSLWQRSILLVSLLVICYTGYGTLFMKFLDDSVTKKYSIQIQNNLVCHNDEQINATFEDTTDYQIWRIHLALFFTSFVGSILSILWILMAKGSKAWQEAHEYAINDLEYLNLYRNLPYDGEHGKWKIKMDSYTHGWWQGGYLWLDANKVSNCFFNTKLGCYSPSKINIMIGIISFFIFIILCVFHTIAICEGILSNLSYIPTSCRIILDVLCFVLLLCMLYVIFEIIINSTTLSSKIVKKGSKRDKQHIKFTNTLENVIFVSKKIKKRAKKRIAKNKKRKEKECNYLKEHK
ncbi:MAG: hypothetical protein II956_11310 [Bacteroidales bacterium]|nr:hypothetical protein [Bacteroidales bacterium]